MKNMEKVGTASFAIVKPYKDEPGQVGIEVIPHNDPKTMYVCYYSRKEAFGVIWAILRAVFDKKKYYSSEDEAE